MKGDKPDTLGKESPLRRKPLRLPGQSLQEEIDRLREDKLDFYLFVGAMLGIMVFMEWAQVLFKLPRQPWLFTLMFAGFVAYAYFKLRPVYTQLQQLKLGRDGERTVGQELEKLRAKGYRVYHDFIADGFNIDHIVIGPTGVFTVETKTFRKPKSPEAEIYYDGRIVTVPGAKLDRDPVAQAKAERDFMRNWIRDNANRNAPVRPAVVFVGWYTQKQPEGAEVWVLNTTGLVSFIQHERAELSQDDIAHISGILETHILKKQNDLYS
jgi:hypothetical protein